MITCPAPFDRVMATSRRLADYRSVAPAQTDLSRTST
jgi:hypothetical protein